jgi:hypothetical protein
VKILPRSNVHYLPNKSESKWTKNEEEIIPLKIGKLCKCRRKEDESSSFPHTDLLSSVDEES